MPDISKILTAKTPLTLSSIARGAQPLVMADLARAAAERAVADRDEREPWIFATQA